MKRPGVWLLAGIMVGGLLSSVSFARASCYVGVLASRGATDVFSTAAGTLTRLYVGVGDRVISGQEIAVVESMDGEHRRVEQEALVEAAHSGLQGARVEVARSRREMERRQGTPELFSAEQIEAAEFQLDRSEVELERHQASLAAARATLARIESEVSRSRILAPFDGTVSARYAVVGSELTAGQPVLHLVATARPIVRFAVPAGDVDRFAVGAEVRAEVANSEVSTRAVVDNVLSVLDEVSQLIFIEASSRPEAWADVPVGAVLRVATPDQATCRGRPATILPD